MSINIGNHKFEGPYPSTGLLNNRSGVYAIHCHNNGKYYLMDVGEAGRVKERVDDHDRKTCWTAECNSNLTVSVLYTPHLHQQGRRVIEQAIRRQYDPPCGER